MASGIEGILMKLDKLHSVDYENDEVQLIKSKVEMVVGDIAREIGEMNPTLSNTVVQCGSFYHNSKITAPDEFDFILVLNKFSQPDVCSCEPFSDPEHPHLVSLQIDYKRLNIDPQSFCFGEDEPSSEQGRLAAKIHSVYHNSIRKCLKTLTLPDGISFTTSQKSVRVKEGNRKFLDCVRMSGPPVTLLLNWKGVKYPSLNITVDMTYVILLKGLPPFCNLEKRLSGEHPIIRAGLCAEASHELLYAQMLDDTWRQTCTILENQIISFWFKQNDYSNICYRLLKIIRDILMPVDQLGEAILKTYALKTLFLYECEQYPDKKFWAKEQLSNRLLSIFEKLLAAFEDRFIPNYFNQTQNALSYPFDSKPDVGNSEEDNRFIGNAYEVTCKITKDIICSLQSSSESDQSGRFWVKPASTSTIQDPEIPKPMDFLGFHSA